MDANTKSQPVNIVHQLRWEVLAAKWEIDEMPSQSEISVFLPVEL
jgi:hypothetical protein